MYVDEVNFIALSEVVDDRGLVEVGEVCHVVGEIELWRVDLINGVAADGAVDGVAVAADQERRPSVLDDPSLDEGVLLVAEPDPSATGELGNVAGIIRAGDAVAVAGAGAGVVGYELWGERAGGEPADMVSRGNGAGHGCCTSAVASTEHGAVGVLFGGLPCPVGICVPCRATITSQSNPPPCWPAVDEREKEEVLRRWVGD